MPRSSSPKIRSAIVEDAFECAAVALAVFDGNGNLLSANSAWRTADDRHVPALFQGAIGSNRFDVIRQCAYAGDQSAAELLRAIERVLAGETLAVRCEFHETTPSARWFDVTVGTLHGVNGLVIGCMDVTERKGTPPPIANAIDELGRHTRGTTTSLLAAAAAHELNQPLFAVVTNAELALHLINADASNERVRELMVAITDSATRATEIIRRMRRLLTGEAPERQELDVNQLVRDVVRMLGEDALAKRVTIECALDKSNPHVFGDPIQLQQVLINLLVNAMEVTTEHGTNERSVEVTTRQVGTTTEIRVNDHGPALEPTLLSRMFEPFYTTKSSGMGLGLYLTRAIVKNHAGSITAHRIADHGLSMRVCLPGPSANTSAAPGA